LSDEERLERQIWREERAEEEAWREAERRIDQERHESEERAAANQQRAIAAAQAREKARQEYVARQERQQRSNDLSALRYEAQQSAAWRNFVQGSLRQQHVNSLYGELEKALTPPAPPPEPEVVHVADDKLGSPNFFDGDSYNPNFYRDKFWGKWK
jgi:hypothetical protein